MKFEILKNEKIFRDLSMISKNLGQDCYVVGGFVRDFILGKPVKDVDVVIVGGDGSEFAEEFSKIVGGRVDIFKTYRTAKVTIPNGIDVEFVGARKESYVRGSRNPVVEQGTLEEDLMRRDFTINSLAICLCDDDRFGDLVDLFNGYKDLTENKIIRTPVDPNITFRDDPLRMLRCIRFASTLGFKIDDNTWIEMVSYSRNIEWIAKERISSEFCKILCSNNPKYGMMLLETSGLLRYILPEVSALDTTDEGMGGATHKNNFYHSINVLDNMSKVTDNVWLRLAALLHDIGKTSTKRYEPGRGWTFYNHEHIGSSMIPNIFKRLFLPMGQEMDYVCRLVDMHMRPQTIANDNVTDSAVRRLCSDFGPGISDLITLCECDLTTKNLDKKQGFLNRFRRVRELIDDLQAKDYVRLFQPVLSGNDIMNLLGIRQGRVVGVLKDYLKEEILENRVPNEKEALTEILYKKAKELGVIR